MDEQAPVTADEFAVLVKLVEGLCAQQADDHELLAQIPLGAFGAPVVEHAYPDWITWVEEWLSVRISRRPQTTRWCTHYAEHAEVADRLEALWHAWETAWPDPVARLAWFRDGLDHQLAVITADAGPLRECSAYEGQHVLPAVLAVVDPSSPWRW